METTERIELLARVERLEDAMRYLINLPAVTIGGGNKTRLRELMREFPEPAT